MSMRQIEVQAAGEDEARARAAELAARSDPPAILVSIRAAQALGTELRGDRRVQVFLWRAYVRDDRAEAS